MLFFYIFIVHRKRLIFIISLSAYILLFLYALFKIVILSNCISRTWHIGYQNMLILIKVIGVKSTWWYIGGYCIFMGMFDDIL